MSSLKPAWVWDLLVVYYQVAEDEVEKADADCTAPRSVRRPPRPPAHTARARARRRRGPLCLLFISPTSKAADGRIELAKSALKTSFVLIR